MCGDPRVSERQDLLVLDFGLSPWMWALSLYHCRTCIDGAFPTGIKIEQ